MEVIVENVRCFFGRHTVPVRPLTFVLGENSSGKTTLLAAISALSRASFPSSRPGFEEPFDLGSYDSIASYKLGRLGRSDYFALGVVYERRREEVSINAVYSDIGGQPRLTSFLINRAGYRIAAKVSNGKASVDLSGPNGIVLSVSEKDEQGSDLSLQRTYTMIVRHITGSKPEEARDLIGVFEQFESLLRREQSIGEAYALAPIRSKPRRTFDQVADDFNPEGGHIPLVLARIWEEQDEREKNVVHDALVEFGQESGLLTDLRVRRLGRNPGEPFQIVVEIDGPPSRNLVDVGYGISQSLPLVVQSVLASSRQRLLIQQPEVHLHPKAQAALGTFFAKLVAAEKKNFVIETHSDYLVDRVRQEVANGTLKPENVQILFLERSGVETSVHPLSVDQNGNLIGAPPGYRRFFLDEEEKLLGRPGS